MARLFAIVVALITIISVGIFASHVWWFPPAISTHGPALDRQFNETFLGTGLLFILSQFGLAYSVWRYRDRGDKRKVTEFPGGSRYTVAAAILIIGIELVGLEFVGTKAWASVYFTVPPPSTLRIQAQTGQFAFYFRYPGPDGKLGPLHPEKIDEALGNFFGLDRDNDADSKDDVVTASLGIPVNQPVEIILHAKDVGHSFYVPELRTHQDAVPGMDIPIHFTATKTGKYEIVCTQLCGLGHYSMRAFLLVMSNDDYQKWLQDQTAAQ